jgi:acyl-CoA thioester hydrolase
MMLKRGKNMAAKTFKSFHKVRSFECDSYGHVNNAVYLNYLEFARMEVLEAKDLTLDKLKDRGYFIVVRRIEIDYNYPVIAGDLLVIQTKLHSYRATSGTFIQEIIREKDKKNIASAKVTWVTINKNGRPVRIPSQIKNAFGMDSL